MIKITENELVELLNKQQASTFITLAYTGKVTKIKKHWQNAVKIEKSYKVNAQICSDIELKKMAKLDDLTAILKPHKYAEHVSKCILEHVKTGKKYIGVICLHVTDYQLYCNGKECAIEDIKHYLQPSYFTVSETDYKFRNYAIANINAITLNRITYTIIH